MVPARRRYSWGCEVRFLGKRAIQDGTPRPFPAIAGYDPLLTNQICIRIVDRMLWGKERKHKSARMVAPNRHNVLSP